MLWAFAKLVMHCMSSVPRLLHHHRLVQHMCCKMWKQRDIQGQADWVCRS